MFPRQLQDEVWGDNPHATASSSIAPFGRTEEVEGGVLFSGEMGWSSGCDHAEWAIVGFRRANPQGGLDYCFGVLPRSDYQIRDDWFAMGMRASGSRTLVVDRAFVPEHRIQRAKDMMEGTSAGFGLYPDSAIFFNPYRPISPVASPPSAWALPSACSKPSRTRPATACGPTPAQRSARPPWH
jgi:hypothetical protein